MRASGSSAGLVSITSVGKRVQIQAAGWFPVGRRWTEIEEVNRVALRPQILHQPANMHAEAARVGRRRLQRE
jgi:hypothetical protein